MKRSIILAWLVGSIVAAASNARADEDADAKREAKQHFVAGEKFLKAGKFDLAITEYGKAYELFPSPAFLFNIGQCHRNLKNWASAISFYEDYLKEAPNSENKAEVEQLIKEAKAELAKSQPAVQKEEASEDDSSASDEKPPSDAPLRSDTPELNAKAVPPPVDSPLVTETEAGPEEGAIYERWWFWAALAGAVVIVAGGTAIALSSGTHTRTELPHGTAGTIDWR
jgi:iron complex outermembrane receptor protein